MPKLKTKKGVAKRFKFSKRKKITYSCGGKSHLATSKTTKRIRRLRRRRTLRYLKGIKYLKRMLPHG